MGFALSSRSRSKLEGVNPDLVRVVELAIERTEDDFMVAEGVRSLERQRELVAAGRSQTMNSRHLTGHAVDLWILVNNTVNWEMPRYRKLAGIVLACADELGVPVEWGGNWRTFKDGPHFQLKRV